MAKKKSFSILAVALITMIAPFLLMACGKDNPDIIPTPAPITEKTFTYNYNEATGNNSVESIEIKRESLEHTTLTVPTREGFEFQGWYLDWLFEIQATNELGELMIQEEIFTTKSDKLFAKWVDDDAPIYEILMVFVTEVKATLERRNGTLVSVDYRMSEVEKQICELTGSMFEKYLNALLNGLVRFDVDQYFTTEPLNKLNINQGTTNPLGSLEIVNDYAVFGYNIPEIGGNENKADPNNVGGLLNEYDSIITTFGLNDYNYLLHCTAGTAGQKYASIHLETVLGGLVANNQSLELALDFDYPGIAVGWESKMQLYLHEFTHTIEQRQEILDYNGLDYHDTLKYYCESLGGLSVSPGLGEGYENAISEIEVIRLYLLNQLQLNDRNMGIPYSFWLK